MTTLGEQLLLKRQATANRVAVWVQRADQPDHPLTYERLWQGATRYAAAYERWGIRPGEVVVLILRHGEELIDCFWGAVLCGAIPSIMPFLTEKLAPAQYRSDLTSLITISLPAAIVTYPEFESDVRAALTADSSVRVVISVDAHHSAAEGDPISFSVQNRDPQDVVLLQHSSGTTGLRKGVALSHQAVFNQLESYGHALNLCKDDVIVSWLPLYHDMGLIAGFVLPVLSGIPLVLSSPFDWVRAPWRLLQTVTHYHGTLSWLPNFAYNFCAQKVRDRDLEGVDLASWRAVINCSEPVRWESHRAFFDRFQAYGLRWESLQTCYAMAENVFGVTQSDLAHGPSVQMIDRSAFTEHRVALPADTTRSTLRMMSSGVPISNTHIQILDAEGGQVDDGRVGEIAVQSDCMLTGYYNRPDVDREAFRDGWYLTGDYGYLSQGELYVSGRRKDLIIVGGKNIFPQDLEALSYEVPGVHQGRSVAFGIFNEITGTEEVHLVVEGDSMDRASHAHLADQVRDHVTSSSVVAVRHVKVVGPKWIVKTSSGKPARLANRDKYLEELATSKE